MTMQATRPSQLKVIETAGLGAHHEITNRSKAMANATVTIKLPPVAEVEKNPAHQHPSLTSVIAQTTKPGDEVVYIGRDSAYTGLIEENGAVAVQVNFDAAPCAEIAEFLKAITPRTRAVVLASEKSSGRSLPREVLATLIRMLTTASNVFGRPLYLISDEDGGESPLEREEYSSVASLYPYTVISSTSTTAQSLGAINHF